MYLNYFFIFLPNLPYQTNRLEHDREMCTRKARLNKESPCETISRIIHMHALIKELRCYPYTAKPSTYAARPKWSHMHGQKSPMASKLIQPQQEYMRIHV